MSQYLGINHHANVTKTNQSLAHHLINYSHTKLLGEAGDADIDDIIAFNTPIVTNWNVGFSSWRNALNFQMGTTIELNAMLEELNKVKAPDWVVKVWSVYPEGSPNAEALVPHGRQAFISGSLIERITGIQTFILGLTDIVALAAVRADATAFLAALQTCNTKHQDAKKDFAAFSKSQKLLWVSATNAMLANEGKLIAKYYETPAKVDLYFAVTVMRRHTKKIIEEGGYMVFLSPGEIKLLDVHFTGKEVFEVTNNGDFDASIIFSNSSTIPPIPPIPPMPDNKFVIPSGETVTIDMNTLADDMRFAFAANLSMESDGELNIIRTA